MKHKKELHVVYIITKLELGGAQKVCLSLFKDVAQREITTHLISSKDGILTSTITEYDHVYLLDALTRDVSFFSLFNELRCFVQIVKKLRTLKKEHPDILVHTHSTKAGILGRWAAWCAGIHTRVHTIHGYSFHDNQRLIIWFMHYAIELITSFITTHYVCVSSQDVKTGIRLFPKFHDNHSIIRAAIPYDHFYEPASTTSRFPTAQEPFIFGSIACFKPQKNIFDLLRAFAQVHKAHSHTRLELIGDGAQRARIELWIKQLNITHAVTLHGWQDDVKPIMLNWHAFTLSSLWEGLPCAIIEARLLHLPVIAYDTGGIHDVIITDENGILCKKGNWQDLAASMKKVVRDKTYYESLSTYKDELDDFRDETMIEDHVKLYRGLFIGSPTHR